MPISQQPASQLPTRREHDLIGDKDVPASAYYGVHTLRAVENFPVTGTPISIYPDLINALAAIKQAAAQANFQLGLLDERRMQAICQACEEIRHGQGGPWSKTYQRDQSQTRLLHWRR